MKLRALLRFSVRASLLALNIVSMPVLAESSIWKVSKGEDYLYLGGAVHLLPASAFPLPAEFEFAYQQADKVVLETSIPEPADKQFQQAMLAALRYQDGTSLEQLLSAEVYQSLRQHFAGFGIPIEQVNTFRPGFIMTQLTVLAALQANMAGVGVDHYFAAKAVEDGKETTYLEALAFQLKLLASLGEGYEDDFIRAQLEQITKFEPLFNATLSAWRSGDVAKLDELIIQPIQNRDPQIYQALFVKRNQDWLPRIEQFFGNAERELVLVGAGHLAGNDSLLVLLAQAGYQLEQINLNQGETNVKPRH